MDPCHALVGACTHGHPWVHPLHLPAEHVPVMAAEPSCGCSPWAHYLKYPFLHNRVSRVHPRLRPRSRRIVYSSRILNNKVGNCTLVYKRAGSVQLGMDWMGFPP